MAEQGEYLDQVEEACQNPELCPNEELHQIAQTLRISCPQLFSSKRFFGIHSPDWEYGSSGIGEECLSLQSVIIPENSKPNCFILGSSILARSTTHGFVKAFRDTPDQFGVSLLYDFGIASVSDRQIITDLLEKIFEKAELRHGGFMIPLPSFYCIFLIEYIASRDAKGIYSQERHMLPRLASQVLSEGTVSKSVLDKLAAPLLESLRTSIEANPNCSEEIKIMYALKFAKL